MSPVNASVVNNTSDSSEPFIDQKLAKESFGGSWLITAGEATVNDMLVQVEGARCPFQERQTVPVSVASPSEKATILRRLIRTASTIGIAVIEAFVTETKSLEDHLSSRLPE